MSVQNTARMRELLESIGFWLGNGRVFYVGSPSQRWFADSQQDKPEGTYCSTIAEALSKCEANRGDTIVVLPGTYTLTATQVVSVAGVTITGIPGREYATAIVGPAALDVFSITAANVTLAYLRISSNDAAAYCASVSGLTCFFDHCVFDALVDGADGVELLTGAQSTRIFDCRFFSSSGGAASLMGFGISLAGLCHNLWVKGCRFTCATSDIEDSGTAAPVLRILVEDCKSTTPAAGIPINLAGSDHTGLISDCRFALATAAAADLSLNAGAGLRWVKCGTEEGVPDTNVSDRPN